MDNRGHEPNEPTNKELQSPKARRGAKGHSEPQGIMRDADLGQMGGGSQEIHAPGNLRAVRGHPQASYVSAEEMRAKQMEVGNTEYMAEMLAEQRENQDRNVMQRKSGNITPTDTSDKMA